jgi:hypothetical protein
MTQSSCPTEAAAKRTEVPFRQTGAALRQTERPIAPNGRSAPQNGTPVSSSGRPVLQNGSNVRANGLPVSRSGSHARTRTRRFPGNSSKALILPAFPKFYGRATVFRRPNHGGAAAPPGQTHFSAANFFADGKYKMKGGEKNYGKRPNTHH